MTMESDKILIVDDEKSVIEALKRAFLDDPYEILSAEDAIQGLALLSANKVKVVISDEMMPGVSGAEFLARVSKNYPGVVRIMLTGHASLKAAIQAINQGEIYRFFTKPWDDFDLRFAVKTAIEKYDLEEENRRLLEIIKKQAFNLKMLEKEFPGISKLEYDEHGRIIADDVGEDEIEKIVASLEKDFGSV